MRVHIVEMFVKLEHANELKIEKAMNKYSIFELIFGFTRLPLDSVNTSGKNPYAAKEVAVAHNKLAIG